MACHKILLFFPGLSIKLNIFLQPNEILTSGTAYVIPSI